MSIVFLNPHWLWLLLAVPAVFFVPERAFNGRAALRALVLAAVALALARPAFLSPDERPNVVYVFDRSPSLQPGKAEEAVQALLAWDQRAPAAARRFVVHPGSGLGAEALPGALTREALTARPGATSDLRAALLAAEAALPEGAPGAIVLSSDGESTDGRVGEVVQRLATRGIPVHPLEWPRLEDDVYPAEIRVDDALRAGRTSRVLVDVLGAGKAIAVTLSGPKGALATQQNIASEGRTTVTFEFEPEAAGFVTLSARVTAEAEADSVLTNNGLERSFGVEPPVRVLHMGARVRGAGQALAKLAGPGFEVESIEAPSPEGALPRPVDFSNRDLIVLDDVPAAALTKDDQDAIVRAVKESGAGLVMSGGEGSFGPGGWLDSPVAQVLPVEFVQKEEKRDPSTTLVVVIDTSGSMGGTRIQLAKETARLAIRRLLPHDKVGLVEFHGAKRWAAPIQPASNSIDIQRALNRLDAGGGTVILPAMEEAYYAMQNIQTRYKHILVLTDGGVEDGPFEALVRRMSEKGITVSTVLTGPEAHSEFLVNLANWGRGRFYTAPNRQSLPEIILKQPTSARLPAYQNGTFSVRRKGNPSWTGAIDVDQAPTISGYCEVKARAGAETVIETQKGHPLLASWRYGSGIVTAFTSEWAGGGTDGWSEWPEFGRLADRILRKSARATRRPFDYVIERRGDVVEIEAIRRTDDDVEPEAALVDKTGASIQRLVFERTAPDRFGARAYVAAAEEIRLLDKEKTPVVGRPGRTDEMQVDPAEVTDLAAIGATTGADRTTFGRGTRTGLTRLWPWLYLLALAGYVADIVLRRR